MVTLALAGRRTSFSWCETINVARAQYFWKFDLWHHDSDRFLDSKPAKYAMRLRLIILLVWTSNSRSIGLESNSPAVPYELN